MLLKLGHPRHTEAVNWIDRYIDRLWKTAPRIGNVSTSFTRWGSIFNAVVCSAIVVGGIYIGATDSPFGFVVAVGTAAMASVFIRVAMRVFRGDFDRA